MDNSYAYEEDELEEGLTFKKIGHFFLKGWVRMIVYAVVLVFVAAIVTLPIKMFYKTEPVAQTSIEFIYDGIEEGLDPNGGTFNTDNIISTTVLKNAIEAAGLSEQLTDISKLRGKMRVEPVPTEEYEKLVQAATDGDAEAQRQLLTYEMFPTRFNIIISDPKKELKLSDNQAKHLLDKVVSAYYDSFKTRYSVTKLFSSDIYNLSTDKTLEFTDVYDRYDATLTSISEVVTLLAQSSTDFDSSAEVTFSALQSELANLELSYSSFNDYILDNNVWRNKKTAQKTFTDNGTRLDAERDAQETYVQSLQTQIALIKPTKITSTNGGQTVETESYPDEYYTYQNMLAQASATLRSLETRIANNQIRITTIQSAPDTTDPALIATAEASLASLETRSEAFVKKVNETISDYYYSTIVSSAVRQVQPPVVTRKTSTLNVVLILLIAAAVGLVAGGIVTVVKITQATAAKAGAVNVESDGNENAEAGAEQNQKNTKTKKQ